MADDTNPEIHPTEFHSCDTPRGMLYYNMQDLTASQQTKLNDLKIRTAREDEQYLAGHPEIRACVALITRHVLQRCPKNNLHDVIAKFFARSRVDIEEEINEYLRKREDHVYQGDSALGLYAKSVTRDSSFQDFSSTVSGEQEHLSDSLKNVGVNLDQITEPPSGRDIRSFSDITDAIFQPELNKFKISSAQMMEDLIASNMLDKIPYDDEIIEEESLEIDEIEHESDPKVSFSPALSSFVGSVPTETVDRAKTQKTVDEIILEELTMAKDEDEEEDEAEDEIKVLQPQEKRSVKMDDSDEEIKSMDGTKYRNDE